MAEDKYVLKVDLNMAYHQIELHPDYREITFAPDSPKFFII